jgi:hypothetical protein
MKLFRRTLTAILIFSTLTVQAQAQIASKKALTLEGARKVLAAAESAAKANNAPGGAIAVVDEGVAQSRCFDSNN